MASHYFLRGADYSVPYDPVNRVVVINQLIDIPALIADPSLLSPSGSTAKLTFFPGFGYQDTLRIKIPPMLVEDMGLYCTTREVGSGGDVDMEFRVTNGARFFITFGGAGVGGVTAHNPVDETDDPAFPIVTLGECAFDPAGPSLILPKHTSVLPGSQMVIYFLGPDGPILQTAVFQVFIKGTLCIQ